MNARVLANASLLAALAALSAGHGLSIGHIAPAGQLVAADSAPGSKPTRGEKIAVVGTLTDEGVECQALQGDDGQLYTLTGNLKKFRNGDRVRVVGRIEEFSFCQQGTTLSVLRITKAK